MGCVLSPGVMITFGAPFSVSSIKKMLKMVYAGVLL